MAHFLKSPVKLGQVAGKNITLNDLPPEAWRIITGGESLTEAIRLYRVVPWLYRGVHLRSQAVSKMPFSIYQGSTVIDQSREWQGVLPFLANFKRILYLYEASLVMEGAAYVAKNTGQFTRKVKELQYLRPDTITPKYEDGELVRFERKVDGKAQAVTLLPREVIYTFYPDLYVENGEGSSPGRAALAASGVLDATDSFVQSFFRNGAIKATILSVDAQTYTDHDELDRLRSWWRRIFTGKENQWAAHVANAKVEPKVIGEGLESLSNNELTREKREDIATALGIPQSLLFSTATTYATAEQDDLHFYDKTVVPDCELIEEDFNRLLFLPLGYRLKFNPDGLDVFQVDETERSVAYKNYTDAGIRPSIAAEMLGIDLPDGVQYADLDADLLAREEREERRLEAELAARTTSPARDEKRLQEELDRWQRKTLRAVKAGKSAVVDFDSDTIPATLRAALAAQLAFATTPEQVKAVFDGAADWERYP